MTVVVGSSNPSLMDESEGPQVQRFGIKRSFAHPKYRPFAGRDFSPYDIALLELNDTIKFCENGIPTTICLPDFDMDEVEPETELEFAGWGKTNVSRMYPLHLDQ